jgi:hypothetical protein
MAGETTQKRTKAGLLDGGLIRFTTGNQVLSQALPGLLPVPLLKVAHDGK